MSWKESKANSILKMKCPRCHEGDLFPPGTLFNPAKFSEMNKGCSCCGQTYEPEPGYYYGAMYVSFGIGCALFVAVWLVLALVMQEVTLEVMMIVLAIISVLLLPLNYRLSRSMWIHLFINYEGPSKLISRKKSHIRGSLA